jgi:hypothetical protein
MRRISLAAFFYAVPVLAGTAILGAYIGTAAMRDIEPSTRLIWFWCFLVWLALTSWIISDSRGRTNISRPFCFGGVALLFTFPYAVYYLFKTKGWFAPLWFLGAIVLLSTCFIAGLSASLLVGAT